MKNLQTEDTAIELHEPHWLSRSAFQVIVFLFLVTELTLAAVELPADD